jgi:hypothetical protein
VPNDPQVFATRLGQAITPERWVFDGNLYSGSELVSEIETVLERATMVIWLNYSLPLVLWRCVKRNTVKGLEEPTRRGQAASVIVMLLDSQSRLWRVSRYFHRQRRQYRLLLDTEKVRHLRIIEFRKPIEAEEFLRGLEARTGFAQEVQVSA